jgi:hypothetical protein
MQSIEEVENELAETLSKLKRISNMPQQPVTDVRAKVIERSLDAVDD